jgi:hypothetical protein
MPDHDVTDPGQLFPRTRAQLVSRGDPHLPRARLRAQAIVLVAPLVRLTQAVLHVTQASLCLGGLCPGLHLLVGQRGEHVHHLAVPLVGPILGPHLRGDELREQGLGVGRGVRMGLWRRDGSGAVATATSAVGFPSLPPNG